MHYHVYDLYRQALVPINKSLDLALDVVTHEKNPLSKTKLGRLRKAVLESTVRMLKHYPKQGFEYEDIVINDTPCPVAENIVVSRPFCNLLRFRRKDLPEDAPKLLCIAALSGHHATLSRETFREFLPDHEVYVTDWLDARDVPLSEGKFSFEDYANYLIEFLEHMGPNSHVLALCQAAVPALTAIAHMSKYDNPARPKSMTLMAGPVDIRINPNSLLKRTENLSAKLLKKFAIHTVPVRYEGVGRQVYPGVMQLGGFMSMNTVSHLQKHWQFFKDVTHGNIEDADKHRDFYDEYMAVLDMDAEYYLDTMERVFLDQHLPKGKMQFKGETITCADIKDTAVLTMEGANDDMISLGQTEAALHLCSNLKKSMKEHHVQKGVGHYGIFNGSIYRDKVAPRVKTFIQKHL